ncbi:MAG: class I SAM-dependent methyltransferase [Patescibacteria group bacterium]|jgi:ubiquinone/menaquinone biosynthesis C-methylase UbiE
MQNTNVIQDQKYFFDLNAQKEEKKVNKNNFFYIYNTEIIYSGFNWLSDRKKIIDYGCGTGKNIEMFLDNTNDKSKSFIGVDISDEAIKKAKEKFTEKQYNFIKISNNKIPQIADMGTDGAYMICVLHHSHEHQAIFNEIYKKLKKNGKFYIVDLTADNIIVNFARNAFTILPKKFRNSFSDDLVVDGKIPEKYVVNINSVVQQLKQTGFEIQGIDKSELFLFIASWVEKFVPISCNDSNLYCKLLRKCHQLEKKMLKINYFNKRAHVFSIKCIKK